ncbi:hypothetical protein ABW20_dc0104468 [Dactylellina cionopaga]|nr:hypothetical protein ABW20_dc0104468 [Dactylellina cionopaga]
MVLSIPSPSLTDLLPPFLSHIPASFASPKPPPSLPPLLTPLTRSRLTHLSFNITSSDSSWLSLLTWSPNPSDGQSLHEHLSSQDYYFLHQTPSPNTFHCKGFRRLDAETLQSLISIPEIELLVLYQFTTDDLLSESGDIGNAWKVHDVRLADDEEALLPAGIFHASIEAAEEEFRTNPRASSSSIVASGNTGASAVEEDDDDDYWGRYGEEDTESSAGDHHDHPAATVSQQHSPVQIAASVLARRMLQEDNEDREEDEYFARYANVEAVLDKPSSETTAVPASASREVDRRDSVSTAQTSTSVTFDHHNLSTPLTAFTNPSTKVSPIVTTISQPQQQSQMWENRKVVADLEDAAAVHTQGEVAIQQHISTSIKSLYRLWKAGGMDGEEFGRFLEREVEVLKVVEEAGELGS